MEFVEEIQLLKDVKQKDEESWIAERESMVE